MTNGFSGEDEPRDTPAPQFARGGLVTGPDGSDSIPVFLELGECWYTAEQVRRFMTAEQIRRFMAAKPGSRDALT